MSILDAVLGGVLGGSAGSSSPMGSILGSLLGGGQAAGTRGAGTGMAGGLGGLLQQFEQAGLGQVAQSWVSNGPNQAVSPQQLQNVLGQYQVQNMASQTGMQPGDFLSQLAQHLPNAVNGMTPNGQVPGGGAMSV